MAKNHRHETFVDYMLRMKNNTSTPKKKRGSVKKHDTGTFHIHTTPTPTPTPITTPTSTPMPQYVQFVRRGIANPSDLGTPVTGDDEATTTPMSVQPTTILNPTNTPTTMPTINTVVQTPTIVPGSFAEAQATAAAAGIYPQMTQVAQQLGQLGKIPEATVYTGNKAVPTQGNTEPYVDESVMGPQGFLSPQQSKELLQFAVDTYNSTPAFMGDTVEEYKSGNIKNQDLTTQANTLYNSIFGADNNYDPNRISLEDAQTILDNVEAVRDAATKYVDMMKLPASGKLNFPTAEADAQSTDYESGYASRLSEQYVKPNQYALNAVAQAQNVLNSTNNINNIRANLTNARDSYNARRNAWLTGTPTAVKGATATAIPTSTSFVVPTAGKSTGSGTNNGGKLTNLLIPSITNTPSTIPTHTSTPTPDIKSIFASSTTTPTVSSTPTATLGNPTYLNQVDDYLRYIGRYPSGGQWWNQTVPKPTTTPTPTMTPTMTPTPNLTPQNSTARTNTGIGGRGMSIGGGGLSANIMPQISSGIVNAIRGLMGNQQTVQQQAQTANPKLAPNGAAVAAQQQAQRGGQPPKWWLEAQANARAKADADRAERDAVVRGNTGGGTVGGGVRGGGTRGGATGGGNTVNIGAGNTGSSYLGQGVNLTNNNPTTVYTGSGGSRGGGAYKRLKKGASLKKDISTGTGLTARATQPVKESPMPKVRTTYGTYGSYKFKKPEPNRSAKYGQDQQVQQPFRKQMDVMQPRQTSMNPMQYPPAREPQRTQQPFVANEYDAVAIHKMLGIPVDVNTIFSSTKKGK